MIDAKLAAKAVLAALIAGGSGAAIAVDATGDATATVVEPLQVSQDTAMDFGQFSAPTSATETITMATDGSMTTSGTEIHLFSPIGTAGAFTITGEPGKLVAVSLGAATVQLSDGGTNTMDLSPALSTLAAALDGTTGQAALSVGGDLDVVAGQAAGSYSGTYTVTVNYQ